MNLGGGDTDCVCVIEIVAFVLLDSLILHRLCMSSAFVFPGDHSEPFTALDISCHGTFLCAGTHQINEHDVFLYVW